MLNVGINKPAYSNIIIDGAEMAQTITGNVQTIYDTAVQGIEKVNMIKQMATQGLNIASLKNMLLSELSKGLGSMLMGGQGDNGKGLLSPQVGSTKGKNQELIKLERDLYLEASKKEYDTKIGITEKNISEYKKSENEKHRQSSEASIKAQNAQRKYDQLVENGTASDEEIRKAWVDYMNVSQEADRLAQEEASLAELRKAQEDALKLLREKRKKVGTSDDAKWEDVKNRYDEIEQQAEDANIVLQADMKDQKDWGNIKDLSGFIISDEDYKRFVRAYFDTEEKEYKLLADDKLRQAYQKNASTGDQKERDRKHLIIITIGHLLQVTATVRRELPERENKIKEIFDATKELPELEAIVSYSNTRIEVTRALALYARLLAAKLQYQAALEIKELDIEKQGAIADFYNFDLSKYILDEATLKKVQQKGEKKDVIKRVNAPLVD